MNPEFVCLLFMYQNRTYPSKILLTGEYTVLLGYPAIAIPWSGRFAQWNDTGATIDVTLQKFYNFIKVHPQLKSEFSLEKFGIFIQSGGYLESNIPFGYGLGSSGSFCAAVLDRFGITDKKNTDIIYLNLKAMEDFFHGHSSGLDPMVSFYNGAVQIENGFISFPKFQARKQSISGAFKVLEALEFSEIMTLNNLYLVDSKLKRDTQHLVSGFKEAIKDTTYLSKLEEKIVPLNSAIIEALLTDDFLKFDKKWIHLSIESLDTFNNMIPESFIKFWKAGIEAEAYYCKLCGAGGGGLFLVKVIEEDFFRKQMKDSEIVLFI